MINLTSNELLAMRACIEVAEPSEDDSGPMAIWVAAMAGMKKIEDEVKAGRKLQVINEAIRHGDSLESLKETIDNIDRPDADLHTCTCNDAHTVNHLCGKLAVAKYDDGLHNVEYFCAGHAESFYGQLPDGELDCGWSRL